jgi:hypothetical protein
MRQQLVCGQIGRLTAVEDGFGDVRGEIAEADEPRSGNRPQKRMLFPSLHPAGRRIGDAIMERNQKACR